MTFELRAFLTLDSLMGMPGEPDSFIGWEQRQAEYEMEGPALASPQIF
jgi:hypothetical protein